VLAGFVRPDRGSVLFGEQAVERMPPHRRNVGMVFQNYALFPHMTVFDNVAFGLRRKKIDRGEIDRRVNEMLELVDLTGRERRRPREMSGGQQQRVALARALVNHPRALLLDEPLGALDLKLRQAMQSELKRIQREVGITFVYVTHDQGEALTMSDRIAVMNAGRVEQLGTPREVYEQPRTRFVADFIGTSNLLTARANRIEGDCAVAAFGDQQRLVVPLRGVVPHGDLEVTVRPEKIRIGTAPIDGAQCQLRGTLEEIVYQGTFTGYLVTTQATHDKVVVHWQNVDDSRDVAAVGDEVWLSWNKDHSYLIDSDPGRETS